MKPIAELLVSIIDRLPAGAADEEAGLALVVVSMEIALPIEARISAGGEIYATPPRGMLATGFRQPHGRLTATFDVRGAR